MRIEVRVIDNQDKVHLAMAWPIDGISCWNGAQTGESIPDETGIKELEKIEIRATCRYKTLGEIRQMEAARKMDVAKAAGIK